MLSLISAESNGEYFAVVKPLAYSDLSPAYERTLRSAYKSVSSAAPFEEWCAERGYHLNISGFFGMDVRPAFDRLRAMALAVAAPRFVDESHLFCEVGDLCFEPRFDATHYNSRGVELIADAMHRLLSAE